MRLLKTLVIAVALTASMSFTALAADAFSPFWEIDSNQVWHYKMNDGSYAKDAWIHDEVNGDWYLLDVNGDMLSGIFCSYGKYYYLDTVRGTGHYGRLLKNGEQVNGVTIKASTESDDEGALSPETIQSLQGTGVTTSSAKEISGTKHISSGVVTSSGSSGGHDSGDSSSQQSESVTQSQPESQSNVIHGTYGGTIIMDDDTIPDEYTGHFSQEFLDSLVGRESFS